MGWFFKIKKIEVLSPLDGYNCWASSYHRESNPVKNLSDELIEKWLPPLHGKSVLDAGCGTGKFCLYAFEQKALRISGIDLAPNMIKQAQKNCPSAEFKRADLLSTSIDEKAFDIVICGLVFGHIDPLRPALENVLRAVAPGGVLIITDFHPFLTLIQSKRTFTNPDTGIEYEVRHHLHLFQEYFRCFIEHGVLVEAFEEPTFRDTPVIFGFRVRKI